MTYTIRVALAQRQEMFLATSQDLRGLFIAHTDLSKVVSETPAAIKLLFKAKMGIDVVVKESASPERRSLQEIVYTADAA